MAETPEPTEALLLGRLAVDGLPGVELNGPLSRVPGEERWALPLRLRADTAGSAILEWTEWYVLLDATYPDGDIGFFPSKHQGLEDTWPHQRRNGEGPADRPWRQGRLCLQTGLFALGLRGHHAEPWNAAGRLAWHVRRARKWLEDAARDRLRAPGDDFELPDLPISELQQVAFREGTGTLGEWSKVSERMGWADLVALPGNSRVLAVKTFSTLEGRRLLTPAWGDILRRVRGSRRRDVRALWLRCDGLPILPPYAAPTTWSEFAEAAQKVGWDLMEQLRVLAPRLRDGERHLCLLGFPVPAVIGAAAVRMHWWALRLPVFAHKKTVIRGYRHNERGYWLHDTASLFGRPHPLDWLKTDNWEPGELRSRGALPSPLRSPRVLLLGAGSLGASMAELLVRGGVSRLVIVDPQALEAGNLVRHTLGLTAVGRSKAKALAERLRDLNPDMEVQAFADHFDESLVKRQWLIGQCDVIVDCTGSDEVVQELGRLKWDSARLFFSASFGFGARRLLCFSARERVFPSGAFWQLTRKWLLDEHEALRNTVLPREGVGCWQPVFPGRADDVWLVAAIAVKALEAAVAAAPAARLDVYEREEEGGHFRGVKHVFPVEEHARP